MGNQPAQRPGTRSAQVRPRVKVWLEKGDPGSDASPAEYVFGWGISEILKAVEQTGSIKGAAGEVGKSYRHVWSRIKSAESNLGRSLVETRVGGEGTHRSQLTHEAQLLVREFDAMRRKVVQLVEQRYSDRIRQIFESR